MQEPIQIQVNKYMNTEKYLAPAIRAVRVVAELGFVLSGDIPNPLPGGSEGTGEIEW